MGRRKTNYTEMGMLVRNRMDYLNMTLEDLSKILNVSSVYLVNVLQGRRHFPEKYKDIIKEKMFFNQKEKDNVDEMFKREEERWITCKIQGKKRLSVYSELKSNERIVRTSIEKLIKSFREEEEYEIKYKRERRIVTQELKKELINFIMDL